MVRSGDGLLSTVAWLDGTGRLTYALEGSVFVTGAAIQWLRDGLGLLDDAAQSEALAASVPDTGGVVFVPALTGLGAPDWDPDARGAMFGLTRGTTRAHLVRATLEAIAFEVRDVIDVMAAGDRPAGQRVLRVDGGASANDLLMQLQADQLQGPVERPVAETTALGAAFLAGLATGVWSSPAELAATWRLDRGSTPGPATTTAMPAGAARWSGPRAGPADLTGGQHAVRAAYPWALAEAHAAEAQRLSLADPGIALARPYPAFRTRPACGRRRRCRQRRCCGTPS